MQINAGKWCTRAEIDLSALGYNLTQVRQRIGDAPKILAVVKADAYGHGAIEVSRELLSAGADMLGVATATEGIRLREAGITVPILLLLGMVDSTPAQLMQYDLTPVIYEHSTTLALDKAARKAKKSIKIHVKLDTGMGRLGFPWEEGFESIQRLMNLKGLEIEGLLTHFAEADSQDKNFTKLQLSRFEGVTAKLKSQGIEIPLLHASNSAAIIDFSHACLNLVRPGIMLYGAMPDESLTPKMSLKPVMRVKTRIIQLKKVPAGNSISYGRTYVTSQEAVIAVIPIGYASGYSRALSNRGQVLIGGVCAPVVGRVCMDMSLVDVTHLPNINVGDDVLLWGEDERGSLPVGEVAGWAGTIAYELLCAAGNRLPRLYYRKGKLIETQPANRSQE